MIRAALFIAALCVAASAGAQDPEPFKASQTKQVTATIQAVSQSDRHLVLRSTDGSNVIVEAGDNISNFDQLRPGDKVDVAYHEGIIAEVKPPGEGAERTTQKTATSSEDGMPSKVMGKQVTTTVEIRSIDPARNMITFKHPDGTVHTLGVANRYGKEFMSKLKPGDNVQLTYREAAAVSIRPAAG